MTCHRRHALLSIAILAPLLAFGSPDARALEHDPGIWTVFSTTDRFGNRGENSRWLYWLDAQARYFDIGSGVNQWLLRPFVGYELSNGIRIWQGYARFRTRNRAGTVVDENRYIQQIDYTWRDWHGGNLSIRARLLERFADTGDDMGLRLRVRTSYIRPIANGASFVVSVEPMIDFRDTDWGGDRGLGQTRFFVGSAWRIGDHWTLQAGYMNQYLVVDGGENRSNHLGVFNFRFNR